MSLDTPKGAPLCLCLGSTWQPVFTYLAPPPGETRFPFSDGAYRREVLRCAQCAHHVSVHDLPMDALYEGAYVSASYGGAEGMRRAFERIVGLDPSRSDNVGRVARIVADHAARATAGAGAGRRALDVGSGLSVFLHRLKAAGWECTALDPDESAVRHAREVALVSGVHADFTRPVPGLGLFDLVTFNKVLEHVRDPVVMLHRALDHLAPSGCVYVELPDGEAAAAAGPGREEFFIEHHHVFSMASIAILVARAGLEARSIERLREPSGKYTLRAFCARRAEPRAP